MTGREERRVELERQMHRALSELPLRRAPASLERRVREAIGPRRGFASWPLVARAAFIACCLASVIVVVLGLKELAMGLAMLPADPRIAGRLQALRQIADVATGLGALLVRLVRMIPPAWVLFGLFATALVYATLFALVAIGYSTLYTSPERSRS